MWKSAVAPVPCISVAGQQALLVQMAVAEVTGIALTELCAHKRGDARTALARQMAMYLCHLAFEMSLSRIGMSFGRDRTTVSHAIHRIEDLREDGELDRILLWLEAMLRRAGGYYD
jgi:chromosomal replication initiation ATPase DnaA